MPQFQSTFKSRAGWSAYKIGTTVGPYAITGHIGESKSPLICKLECIEHGTEIEWSKYALNAIKRSKTCKCFGRYRKFRKDKI
jgi:hypothetical protein